MKNEECAEMKEKSISEFQFVRYGCFSTHCAHLLLKWDHFQGGGEGVFIYLVGKSPNMLNAMFVLYLSCNKLLSFAKVIISSISYYHLPPALWAGGGTRLPFPCVSYQSTKRGSRWQCIHSVGLRWPPMQPLQSRLNGPKCCHYTQVSLI